LLGGRCRRYVDRDGRARQHKRPRVVREGEEVDIDVELRRVVREDGLDRRPLLRASRAEDRGTVLCG
jgi:hypothetical protein